MLNRVVLMLLVVTTAASCVSKKKYAVQVDQNKKLTDSLNFITNQLDECLAERRDQAKQIERMGEEIKELKANANALLNQMKDLAIISASQAESISKSLENINSKDKYIRGLHDEMARKDSLNMALVLSLKGALKDINDSDIEINVDGSAVFISISDKLLFASGKYQINPEAKAVLGKVAQVLKSKPDIRFMVEGHTDNKPINTDQLKDNWDLSVLRATSVVRALQTDFGIDPARMIAAGRSEYVPISTNDTEPGRASNRRTRIVIIPELDQFFKLIEGSGN